MGTQSSNRRAGYRGLFWVAGFLTALAVGADAAADLPAGNPRENSADSAMNWSSTIVPSTDRISIDAASTGVLATAKGASAASTKTILNPTTLNGHWFNPSQSGHGFTFVFVNRPDGSTTFVVTWYVYLNGQQVWILGSGNLVGNSATVPAVITSGGQFPPMFVPGSVVSTNWGTISIDILSCSQIVVAWSPLVAGFSAGSMVVEPLAIGTVSGAGNCQIVDGSGDDYGNTCATATPAAANGTVSGVLFPSTDQDFFRIELGGAAVLTAQSSSTPAFDIYGSLYNANCALIVGDDDGLGVDDNFRISVALAPGVYYLAVSSLQGLTTGHYSVFFSTSSATP